MLTNQIWDCRLQYVSSSIHFPWQWSFRLKVMTRLRMRLRLMIRLSMRMMRTRVRIGPPPISISAPIGNFSPSNSCYSVWHPTRAIEFLLYCYYLKSSSDIIAHKIRSWCPFSEERNMFSSLRPFKKTSFSVCISYHEWTWHVYCNFQSPLALSQWVPFSPRAFCILLWRSPVVEVGSLFFRLWG